MANYNLELTIEELNLILDAMTLREVRVDELISSFNSASELDAFLIDLYTKEKKQLRNIRQKFFDEKYK